MMNNVCPPLTPPCGELVTFQSFSISSLTTVWRPAVEWSLLSMPLAVAPAQAVADCSYSCRSIVHTAARTAGYSGSIVGTAGTAAHTADTAARTAAASAPWWRWSPPSYL